ncbi:acetylxylan esterase [Ruania zhangjianzhongii]|uniref:acetylxylan esterase n=1 Tax=Ruania zhangjianzhongii TaxID=2603206 RepID=UPI0011CA32E2|nr:acetylxylan esterase [Ruania zhangjianzhongii]
MPQFDLPLEQLRSYRTARAAPPGHTEYWQRTLAQSRAAGGSVRYQAVDAGLAVLDAYDVTFSGFGGHDVHAWHLVPRGLGDRLPVVVEFLGYGGGRGLVHERLTWAAHGFAQLVVDSRGQGGIWNTGDTPDPHGSGPATPGLLTRGVEHPYQLYYRRLLTDAALAVDAAAELPGTDPDRIATIGHSQGGAMALAAAALNPRVAATGARAPFLCGIARNLQLTDAVPYGELSAYLALYRDRAEQVLDVLDHVDLTFLTPQIACPTWISVGLTDLICPPSGIFGAINALGQVRPEVRTWPYNGHEAGGPHDEAHLAGWLHQQLPG